MTEPSKAEPKLIEKIAKILWLESPHYGFRQWSEFEQHYLNIAGSILALLKEAGYVQLAEDQIPPNYVTFDFQDRERVNRVQLDMFKASWRKVKLV